MKNITYLFGAGASANALPVQNKLQDAVVEMSRLIKDVEIRQNWDYNDLPPKRNIKKELVIELDWLAEQIKSNGTPDVLAENLTRQRKIKDLRRLKIIYSTFLVLLQCSKVTEQRYIRFLNRIMDMKTNQIKPNVRILSWNYDFQLERGFSDYSHSSLWQLQLNYGFYQPNFYGSTENSRASIFNLNGTASFYNSELNEHTNKYDFDFHSTLLTESSFDAALRIFGIIRHIDTNYNPHLSFSWENNAVINNAIEKVKDTNILIVVGYSFPDENREVDSRIITSMKNLTEFHVQDPEAHNLCYKLKEHFMESNTGYFPAWDRKIIERNDARAFHIPNDLY
jgi:hypothetical protein